CSIWRGISPFSTGEIDFTNRFAVYVFGKSIILVSSQNSIFHIFKTKSLSMKKTLLLAAILILCIITNAQQLWKEEPPASQNEFLNRNRNTVPDHAKFYTLNAATLQAKMTA